jgi:hypothetical protein
MSGTNLDVLTGANRGVTWEFSHPGVFVNSTSTGAGTPTSIESSVSFTVSADVPVGTIVTVTATSVSNTARSDTQQFRVTAQGEADWGTPPRQGGGVLYGPFPPIELPTQREADDLPPEDRVGVPDPTFPADAMTPAFMLFNDVPMDAWFHEAVTIVNHHSIMRGTAFRTFEPNRAITRAEFVQVLANHANANLASFANATADFADVQQGVHWAFPAIQWAQSVGFNLGVNENHFAPNAPISRQEMASLLRRYTSIMNISLPSNTASAIVDTDSIAAWAADDVAAIRASGLMNAREGGMFAPRASVVRAEVAQVFANFIGVTGR